MRVQAVSLGIWGYIGACALGALRRDGRRERAVARFLFALLALSMATTYLCVAQSGESIVQTLLPLHLCSLCAFLSLAFYLRPAEGLYHFLWYLGMPCASLALLFPSILRVPWQGPLDAAFFATHALIVLSPLTRIAQGFLPRRRGALRTLLWGNAFAACVYAANRLLGTNYLFLMAAPYGTPLQFFESLGRIPYLLAIEAVGAGAVGAMYAVTLGLERRGRAWYNQFKRDSDPSGNAVR